MKMRKGTKHIYTAEKGEAIAGMIIFKGMVVIATSKQVVYLPLEKLV